MNILVTGVSKGIGLAISKKLLETHHTVFGISRTQSKELEKLQKKFPENLFLLKLDLENVEEINGALKDFLKGISINSFVNNAAISYQEIIANINYNSLEKIYRVNVFAPMMITKWCLKNMMLHRTEGSFVHISSVSAHTAYKGLGIYASTKGAVEVFSRSIAREWGEKNIRSNTIVSGFVETDMSNNLTDEQKLRIIKRTSLKKNTDPDSIAETVIFLLSEKSKSITGQNIHVDSGTI